MKNAYYTTFNTENTLACRNNGTKVEAHGVGAYIGKAPTIETVCEAEGMTLKAVKGATLTRYEVICEGELFSRSNNKAEAEALFMDFARISKAKFKKLCAEQTAKQEAALALAAKKLAADLEEKKPQAIFKAACLAA